MAATIVGDNDSALGAEDSMPGGSGPASLTVLTGGRDVLTEKGFPQFFFHGLFRPFPITAPKGSVPPYSNKFYGKLPLKIRKKQAHDESLLFPCFPA